MSYNILALKYVLPVLAAIVILAHRVISHLVKTRSAVSHVSATPSNEPFYPDVGPIDRGFSWENEPPRPYRPYKPGPWTMTMGIQSLPHDDWLLLDNTYLHQTAEKKRVTETLPQHTVFAQQEGNAALLETYTFMVEYLIQRFPQYFVTKLSEKQLLGAPQVSYPLVYNTIRDDYFPRDPTQFIAAQAAVTQDTYKQLVRLLTRNVQEDFIVVQHDPQCDRYVMRGGSFAFPTGFDPAQKIGQPLAAIHTPIPYYMKKLATPMDKFFARAKPGAWVQRTNWGVQPHAQLCVPTAHPLPPHPDGLQDVPPEDRWDVEFDTPLDPSTLDFHDGVFLRCERQGLLRLPKSGAMLFTIRTYLTPIAFIRDSEGDQCAANLVAAIENMPPAMAMHKGSDKWGPGVIAFLKRETEGCRRTSAL
ncbi:uncharacterized protein SAPINGB_P001274 [Magnusiomyces paraingens]|uniref:HRQ family protein 2 n=1 Tax=Magnusiomyces paraingens TaxID=2606893 RepID=A0A5E8B4V5_9ASCO|nr:uncharacterized protein SAPINGB_P001274 [Saprochaete ingens]VVT46560.1 unnamed protein product [Saprochaete ingens]